LTLSGAFRPRLQRGGFGLSSAERLSAVERVNLGDDADTTGAVYGQLAGAFYGEEGIPEDWREKISYHELIVSFAEKLFRL
jgi:ADP-ribosylglycohydrolase